MNRGSEFLFSFNFSAVRFLQCGDFVGRETPPVRFCAEVSGYGVGPFGKQALAGSVFFCG